MDFYDNLIRWYILDFLSLSESPKTIEEVAKGSIYSRNSISEFSQELLNNGELDYENDNGLKITKRGEENVVFDDIGRSYVQYLKRIERIDSNMNGSLYGDPNNPDDTHPFPLKNSIAEDTARSMGYVEKLSVNNLEDDYFMNGKNSLPTISDLSPRNLERLSIILLKPLWLSVSQECKEYWDLTYEISKTIERGTKLDFSLIQRSTQILFHIALSSNRSGSSSTGRINHTNKLLENTQYIASFVAYPLLESLVKLRCSSDIEIDGTVKKKDTVRDYGSNRDFYDKNNICSSLRDLLIHFEKNVADDQLREQLEQIREEISGIAECPKEEVYGLIYQWRCTVSHEGTSDLKYTVILNFICMLIWNEARKKHPDEVSEIVDSIEKENTPKL